jgi:TolB protein
MRKPSPRLSSVITIPVLIGLLLGCTRQIAIESPEVVSTFATLTETPEFIPTAPAGAQEMVILSYEEDGYAHLFAYIPEKMPLTRLTFGDWDDVSPAASPNGERIAFASNRNGFWDLYLLDLTDGDLTQLTDTPGYEGAPTWSPDSSFLAYEAYDNENLEIFVGPWENPAQNAIQLTVSSDADYAPAWSPGGRQIAFISNGEVILADLDKTGESRFANLSNTELAEESHPVWSPDGTRLAWASSTQTVGRSGIYVWDATRNVPAEWIGDGDYPAWNTTGDQILTTIPAPNETYLTIYSLAGELIQPLTPFPMNLRGLVWANLLLPASMPEVLQQAARSTPASLWAPNAEPISEGPEGRWALVDLKDVQAPYPQMHDLADEAFVALRERVTQEAGWDALGSLESAFVPLSTSLDPGFEQDWLYTGRAFAINSLMTNAGWMVAVREDIGAQTYWRLYLRAQLQDGSLGEPLHNTPWDLSARYNLDPKIYEQGGKYSTVPPGYWMDVTSLARQYGWQRVPALPNWRTFYRGARFTEFALTDGIDFYSAMLQLYPPDVLLTPTRVLPPTSTPSRTPTATRTATSTRTPRPTFTPSATRTPSITPTPSNTPVPSQTPVTVVP